MRPLTIAVIALLTASAPTFAAPKVKAVRADKPPVLDGKLDDACWQKAKPITGFKVWGTDILATPQSFGYVSYDDAHLYIAMKCVMAPGKQPVGEKRPHDGNLWGDDHVEVMIDPGKSELNYFQLVASPFGATFDCSRKHGGDNEDDSWDGEWSTAGHVGDGFYSIEMAIPFHNMGLTFDTDALWGVNLCRDSRNPRQLSAISDEGIFNDATKFPGIADIKADFSKYSFPVGPGYIQYEPSLDPPAANLIMPVRNRSGKDRTIRIDMYEGERKRSQTLPLPAGQSVSIRLEQLPVEPLIDDATDLMMVTSDPKTTRIEVRDAKTDTILQVRRPKPHAFCEVLTLDVVDNWRRGAGENKSTTVEVNVKADIARPHLMRGSLRAELIDRSGKVVAAQTKKRPKRTTTMRFDAADLPWAAYTVRVDVLDRKGQSLAKTDAPAVVLPGGQQAVKVLNNFVSELMDTQARGLGPTAEVQYMNPRDGWVFFDVDGKESMKKLAAGRHTLKLYAPADRIVIRAIPELIYCQYQASPHVRPHGPYDWAFLNKHVLPHCNLIVGDDHPEEMKQWRAQGKHWLTHVTVPNLVTKKFEDADAAFAHWKASSGYSHPLMDGMIADEFLGFSANQYVAYLRSIRTLRQDPKFTGRDFYAWCGAVYGLDAGKAFMRVLLRSGWHHCFERYLPERVDEASAMQFIQDKLINTARGWEHALPGSTRSAVITLGYMSQPNESLNHYPWVNFRVYMDMQFEALANEPALFGIYGIMEYLSSYTDEEAVRWAGKLYRHYCIEGNTGRLTDEPYVHDYLTNADFDDGVKGWTIKEGETGAVRPGHHTGLGWLQGRYPNTAQGDKFLIMKRSPKDANSFSQTIRSLKPGTIYSMKMFTGDYGDLVNEVNKEQVHAVRIDLDGVELLTGERNNFQFPIANCYSHELGKFDRDHNYWVNYHWRVFRARGTTATITVCDWRSDTEPGGAAGQEIAYNFIEVQPYDVP